MSLFTLIKLQPAIRTLAHVSEQVWLPGGGSVPAISALMGDVDVAETTDPQSASLSSHLSAAERPDGTVPRLKSSIRPAEDIINELVLS